MHINYLGGLRELKKKQNTSTKSVLVTHKSLNSTDSNKLSFMSIPSIAFKGNMVIPTLPKGLRAQPSPKIKIHDDSILKGTIKKQMVDYKVYPQDPLVTKTSIYSLEGTVMPGPENNRIKTVDDDTQVARPNKEGNYIEDVKNPQFDRVNAFAFVHKTLKMYEKALGREIPWAFPAEQLDVHPLAGVMMNAYYSRWDHQIKLFYFQNRFDSSETCYTSKMADVITHETGHAVLDGLRPSYIGWGSHGGAIHEGFGDSTAMLVSMFDDKILDQVIEQTDGNLQKENLIASLGEQFGKAVYGNKLYLRNAINDLKMSDFGSGAESKEVHNFGRLFGAMFYDIICDMTAEHKKSMPLKEALVKTRDDLVKMFARAMGDFAPPGNVYYHDIAKAFLKADKEDFNGKYQKLLASVFSNREILDSSAIKEWEAQQRNLPSIKLPPKTIASKTNLIEFVNNNKSALGLPKDNVYQLESAYTNNFGETFIQLKTPKKIEIPTSEEFGGKQFSITI
ncbi:MAG: M36 family metallopeptidase, partial [Cyanobacteriota bacterium]